MAGNGLRDVALDAGIPLDAATFLGGVAVGVASAAMARCVRTPVAIVAFAGAVTMMPGTYMYQALGGLLRLARLDPAPAVTAEFATNLARAFVVVTGLVLGLVLGSSGHDGCKPACLTRRPVSLSLSVSRNGYAPANLLREPAPIAREKPRCSRIQSNARSLLPPMDALPSTSSFDRRETHAGASTLHLSSSGPCRASSCRVTEASKANNGCRILPIVVRSNDSLKTENHGVQHSFTGFLQSDAIIAVERRAPTH